MKLLLLEIDNVLYDSDLLKGTAREWAITAMKEVGLPVDFDTALETLMEVIREKGEDYPFHFNEMMRRLGLKEDFRVISAGVIAYHDVKRAFLKPLPGVIETILAAREEGAKVGIISEGDPVKEWEKVIRLGVHHLIHFSWIGKDISLADVFSSAEISPQKTVFLTGNEEKSREAMSMGVRSLILITRNRAQVVENGKTKGVYETWQMENAVRNLLRRL